MNKLVTLLLCFLTSICVSCAPRVTIQPLSSEDIGKCIPIRCDISYAQGINASDHLQDAIVQSLQAYIDDPGWWGVGRKEVTLAINITQVEMVSRAAILFLGVFGPPNEVFGEVTIYDQEKPLGKYKIEAALREASILAFADLEKRIAETFARMVMDSLRQ